MFKNLFRHAPATASATVALQATATARIVIDCRQVVKRYESEAGLFTALAGVD